MRNINMDRNGVIGFEARLLKPRFNDGKINHARIENKIISQNETKSALNIFFTSFQINS